MSGTVVVLSDTWLGSTYVRRGETWAADDPLVAEHPTAFTADPEAAGLVRRSGPRPPASPPSQVEQATAAPGERRDLPPRTPGGRSKRPSSGSGE